MLPLEGPLPDAIQAMSETLPEPFDAAKTLRTLEKFEALWREFAEANPHPDDFRSHTDPAYKARFLARYMEHLASAYERFSALKDDDSVAVAATIANDIQSRILDQGTPHERLAKMVFLWIEKLPGISSHDVAVFVLRSMWWSHPEVASRLQMHRLIAAVEACRIDGRKNRKERRREASVSDRWEALANVLEGTGAQVTASAIEQAWQRRHQNASWRKKRR